MGYMKEQFESWIGEIKRNDGSTYSRETISGYISSLRTHASRLSDIQIDNTDLFYYDSSDKFKPVYVTIKASGDFDRINKEYHRIFSSALKMYDRFLAQLKNENGQPPVRPSFKEWLKVYPKHKYTEATITRYIRALDKSAEWLGIELDKPVLSISSSEEFNLVQKRIKDLPNYAEVNQGHGHGDLSAALRLYEAYLKFNSEDEHPEKTEEMREIDISVREAVDKIKLYIAAKGFSYNQGMIENFYLSLKSKPFVILAGTSGTGKTRLVKLFAEAIGAEYFMVPVRPDWSDGSDLFGHYDLNGNFIEGPVCPAFKAAAGLPDKPVFLCLDEMNLARVEYYLSDFLSVIESREKQDDGAIRTDPIAQFQDGIPDNLYIVGTVNMDETTFPFSKKVLDRANTIEFSYVDLEPSFDAVHDAEGPVMLTNDYLRTEYLVLTRDCAVEKEYVSEICSGLRKINEILVKANLHVGYRVRDEIVFYLLNNKKAEDLLSHDQALDNEIMQKILPRVQGSATMIRDMLVELFKFCMGDYSGLDIESGQVGKKMQDMASNAKYVESAKKIAYMMTRFEEDGFTSYWL